METDEYLNNANRLLGGGAPVKKEEPKDDEKDKEEDKKDDKEEKDK